MSILLDESSAYCIGANNMSLKRSISYNPRVHQRDGNGNTVLMYAVSEGREEEVETLIDEGSDVNAQNFAAECPLFIAAARGHTNIAKMLLENGANSNVANLDNVTPVHMAAASGHDELVYVMARYGAYVNAGDDEGDRPLHWAVRESKMGCVHALLKCGADHRLSNEDGETPMDLAAALGDGDMLKFFGVLGISSDVPPIDMKPGGSTTTTTTSGMEMDAVYQPSQQQAMGNPNMQNRVHGAMIVDRDGGWVNSMC